MATTFGDALREQRRIAGISQRELAERIGLDFSYISKVENGRLPPPSADTIVAICSVFGINAETLLALTWVCSYSIFSLRDRNSKPVNWIAIRRFQCRVGFSYTSPLRMRGNLADAPPLASMQIKSHSESHLVELDDGSKWQIFPGDLDVTLNWQPDTELKIVRIDDRVSSHALVSINDNSSVRVLPEGEKWLVDA